MMPVVAKFPLGRIAATKALTRVVSPRDACNALCRHCSGDWGDVCEEDRKTNEQALVDGSRLMSVYRSAEGVVFWVITEADRSFTTILLPEDY